MKKKLTRALIDEIRKEMPILSEEEMRYCSGGDGTPSWDCLFNCMNYINPSKSALEYAKEYADRYNLDPSSMGGVPENYTSDVLSTLGFNNVSTNSIANSSEYYQIITIKKSDGNIHSVIALSSANENGDFEYCDPTAKVFNAVASKSDITAVYLIRRSDLYNHDNAGDENNVYEYNNYIDVSNSIFDYSYNYDYGNYDYNRDDWNDYNL